MPPVKPVLNHASLNTVRPELLRLLEQAQSTYAVCAESGAGTEPCAKMLAQADGVLRLLELGDAAQLARDIGAAMAALPATHESTTVARALQTLQRYIAYLSSCREPVPDLLAEDNDAVRSLLGVAPLPETAFVPECAAAPSACPQGERVQGPDEELVRSLRHQYQLGLLGVIRRSADSIHPRLMRRAAERMLRASGGGEAGEFWWLLGGVLEGLVDGHLIASVPRLRLLSQGERRLHDWLKRPERRAAVLEPELREALLGAVARSGAGERAREIRARTGVPAAPFTDAELQRERERLSGASDAQVEALVAELELELRAIRERLERLAQQGPGEADTIAGVREALARIAGLLSSAGLEVAARQISARSQAFVSALGKEDLLDVADAVVRAESALDAWVRGRGVSGARMAPETVAALGAAGPFEQARAELLQGARASLEQVKRDVLAFAGEQHDAHAFDGAVKQLDAVRGGLLMLEHRRAAALPAGLIVELGRDRSRASAAVRASATESFADVLICLEYYLAALAGNEQPDSAMLELAERNLASLRAG